MTNSNAATNNDPANTSHTPPTHTDLTNNSSPVSAPSASGSAGASIEHIGRSDNAEGVNPANSDNSTADPMAQPQPPAQDAGQTASAAPDLHTSPPTAPLSPTSSTGTGFNTPDAGTNLPADNINSGVGNPGPMTSSAPGNSPLPDVGNIDRDALAGQNKGAGSQANAEAVSSTGPV